MFPALNGDSSHCCCSEDYLRAQLMRSTSDEAINSKSDVDLDDDSIRSPFRGGGGGGGGREAAGPRGGPPPPPSHVVPRGYPLLSPQSPPSDSSSYQGSMPGSAPSDRYVF